MLLLHYTAMVTAEAAVAWLCDPRSRVSCHYLVDEGGRIFQMVREEHRAWHAGKAAWQGERDVNSLSIGIEIANLGHEGGCPPYPEAQIAAVIALARDIIARHAIPPWRVLGHSDVAPQRKRDPGEHFPWERLFSEGIGLWVPRPPQAEGEILRLGDEGSLVSRLQAELARFGYDIEISGFFDDQTEAVVCAFQRHFRPETVNGRADAAMHQTLKALLQIRNTDSPDGETSPFDM